MRTDISVTIELSEDTSMLTKVSLKSFIEHNKWFNGTVYLLTFTDLPIKTKTLSEIKMIYPQIEVLNITDDKIIARAISSIKSNSKEVFSSLIDCLKLGTLLIDGNVLYLSHRSLFLSSVEFMLSEREITVSQILNSDSSSIFYITDNIDKSSMLTNICNSLMMGDSVFSKRKIDLAFSTEFKKESSIQFIPSSKASTSSNYSDRYFTKLKANLSELACLHFEEKMLNSSLHTKINQLWLHKARNVKLFTNKPASIESRNVLTKTSNLEYIKSTVSISDVEKNFKVSVIIPAYKAEAYIEECLDSIIRQTTSAELEILIGIDNCESTLKRLKQIKNKYPNLRVFYSNSSLGAYVMRNTLSEMVKHDHILFFDADDIMIPSMVSSILRKYNKSSPVRFKYINFNQGEDPIKRISPHPKPSHGVFFISRNLFNRIGGFQNWPCGADTEFMKRCSFNKINDTIINAPLFYRRIHSTSLTQNPETGYRSNVRSQINLRIKNMIDWRIPIRKVTSKISQIQ